MGLVGLMNVLAVEGARANLARTLVKLGLVERGHEMRERVLAALAEVVPETHPPPVEARMGLQDLAPITYCLRASEIAIAL